MRRAIFEIEAGLLLDLFRDMGKPLHYQVMENGLPPSVQVVGAYYDCLRDVWRIAVEDDSFPDVPAAHELPVLPPVIVRTIFDA